MAYIKDKTLNTIYEKFFVERKEFKTKQKISFFERASLFIPGISLFASFNINRKVKKEIERAERESNIKIEQYTDGCCDIAYKGINIFINIIFFLASSKLINLPISGYLSLASFIFLVFFPLFMVVLGLFANNSSIQGLENFINKNNFRKDEALSENDMLLLTKNIDHDILNDFLIERDFKITYKSLLQLQEKIDNYDYLKEKRKKELENKRKANSILSVLSEKIKEKEVVNV